MVEALAVRLDPVGVGHAHARGGAVPGEDDVGVGIDLGEIGDLAITRVKLGDVLELQFLDDVGDPAFAEGFPGDGGDGLRSEQRPQRHLDGAGIGRRHDADLVVGRHFQHFARQLDGLLELDLADLGAVRAAERCVLEILGIPAGALGTGAGGKMRHGRPLSGLRYRHDLPFQIVSLPLGGGVPPLPIWESALVVKELRWHASPEMHGRAGSFGKDGARGTNLRAFTPGRRRPGIFPAAGAGRSSTRRRRSRSRWRQSPHRPSSRCS